MVYCDPNTGNFLTHLSHQASRQNMPFKGWQNLLEVPIASQHTHHTHPPIFYSFNLSSIIMPGAHQCANAVRHAIEFNRGASHLQQEPIFSKLPHHYLMDQTLTLSSLLVQISICCTAQLLPSLSEVIPIIWLHCLMTFGMKILFWQPLVLVVVNSLGWRFLPTKRCCW